MTEITIRLGRTLALSAGLTLLLSPLLLLIPLLTATDDSAPPATGPEHPPLALAEVVTDHGSGSGIVIGHADDGGLYVLTADHVIDGNEPIVYLGDHEAFASLDDDGIVPERYACAPSRLDVCLVKLAAEDVTGDYNAVVLDTLQPDEWVTFTGVASGISTGRVIVTDLLTESVDSKDASDLRELAGIARLTSHSASGDSGAGALNSAGALVGIVHGHDSSTREALIVGGSGFVVGVLDLIDQLEAVTARDEAAMILTSPTVGQTLTASAGTWPDASEPQYQWTRDGEVIEGATGATYVTTVDDIGARIGVVVTGTAADGTVIERRTELHGSIEPSG